jgi:predicted ATP-dependent serine protease
MSGTGLAVQGQGPPLRVPTGVNRNRLALIIAVLTKHLKLRMFRVDVHTNVVGGLLMQVFPVLLLGLSRIQLFSAQD